jgi:stage IV sporulation protein FB
MSGERDASIDRRQGFAMRDPFSWSFPLCHVLGITVRIHILMPLVMGALILRPTMAKDGYPGTWIDVAWIMGLLFVSVLLHEFGHCFAARRVDGEASEVLLWPLGGLARVELPHAPSAHFITAAAGPMVNLGLCALSLGALAFLCDHSYRPSFNPLAVPLREKPAGEMQLAIWGSEFMSDPTGALSPLLLVRLFYVNWLLSLFNLVLVGFPMDSGRMLQATLWTRIGYRQATFYAIVAGFICMFGLLIASIWINEVLLIALAIFVYLACKQEWIMLETGSDDSVFGYDFSQGYTSLEREEAPPVKPREPNFLQRWLRRRAERKRLLEAEQQIAEELRMDQLLEKIHRYGNASLTDEEQRFLKRVATRYRKKSS